MGYKENINKAIERAAQTKNRFLICFGIKAWAEKYLEDKSKKSMERLLRGENLSKFTGVSIRHIHMNETVRRLQPELLKDVKAYFEVNISLDRVDPGQAIVFNRQWFSDMTGIRDEKILRFISNSLQIGIKNITGVHCFQGLDKYVAYNNVSMRWSIRQGAPSQYAIVFDNQDRVVFSNEGPENLVTTFFQRSELNGMQGYVAGNVKLYMKVLLMRKTTQPSNETPMLISFY